MLQNIGVRRVVLGAAVGFIALFLALAGSAAGWLVTDDPRRSDVILVLAGETDHRPAQALELLGQGYGRRMIIDVPAQATMYGFSDLELAQRYVLKLSQPRSVSICPIYGLSTRDESHDAEKCLTGDESSVLIVTSDYHTHRALNIFRHQLRGRTFSVAAAYNGEEFGRRWWTRRQWAKTCVEESAKWVWWSAVDRWR